VKKEAPANVDCNKGIPSPPHAPPTTQSGHIWQPWMPAIIQTDGGSENGSAQVTGIPHSFDLQQQLAPNDEDVPAPVVK
jgi:hypothetical protein